MDKKNLGKRYPDELRTRVVRTVLDHESEYRSRSAVISSVSQKVGCSRDSLRNLFGRAVFCAFTSCATIVLSLLLFGTPLLAQTDKSDLKAIEEHVTRTLERDRAPGAAVGIIRGEDIVFLKGFGRHGTGRPVDQNTRFVIGSMSKAFTALVAMRLIEAGQVTLDTPVVQHVPELQGPQRAAWQDATLGILLTHTSGLPTRTPVRPSGETLSQHVEALAGVELTDPAGSTHVYSSDNYLVAARMLETITATPFNQLLSVQVFLPLGFQSDQATLGIGTESPHLGGHQYWFVWPRQVDLVADTARLATASVTASAAEMARFLQFQLGDGQWDGQTLLSPEGFATMHEGTAQGDGFTYGLGWRTVELGGVQTIQHGGVLPNYRGKMILLPDQGSAVIVLTNASSVLPLPIRPTSHRLADDIALYLAGGPLGWPNLGYRTWLIAFWCGLSLILLHQLVTLAKIALKRDPARHPLRSAAADIAMVCAIVFVLPWAIGLSLHSIVVQTPDLALWLAAMTVLALCAVVLRIVQAVNLRRTGS